MSSHIHDIVIQLITHCNATSVNTFATMINATATKLNAFETMLISKILYPIYFCHRCHDIQGQFFKKRTSMSLVI
jgi:hypothetical protein